MKRENRPLVIAAIALIAGLAGVIYYVTLFNTPVTWTNLYLNILIIVSAFVFRLCIDIHRKRKRENKDNC